VTVSAVAPGIFLKGNPPLEAITNQDFSLAGPTNPCQGGQALVTSATGLCAVTQRGPGYSVLLALQQLEK
jgi:uncharacterized protein (TIGR03437 family)